MRKERETESARQTGIATTAVVTILKNGTHDKIHNPLQMCNNTKLQYLRRDFAAKLNVSHWQCATTWLK